MIGKDSVDLAPVALKCPLLSLVRPFLARRPSVALASFIVLLSFDSGRLAQADLFRTGERGQASWHSAHRVAAGPGNPATTSTASSPADRMVEIAQGSGPAMLPSLVLPPGTTTEPPMFLSIMQMADSAMVRGDITRARALYERAAAIHPTSTAACILAGKTYDPNILPQFGGDPSFANVARAREWYERARALGDPHAAALLASLR